MEEAKHDDKEKLPLQWILLMSGLDDVARVGAYGAKKYGQNNWRGGSEWMRYLGSIVRHTTAYIRGEDIDKESGMPHMAHCAYNCLILLTWAKEGKGTDDRPQIHQGVDTRTTLFARLHGDCISNECLCHSELFGSDCEVIE